MTVVTKRSSMTFFSDPSDLMSHRVRVVLFEKGVTVEVIDCDPENACRGSAGAKPLRAADLGGSRPVIVRTQRHDRIP